MSRRPSVATTVNFNRKGEPSVRQWNCDSDWVDADSSFWPKRQLRDPSWLFDAELNLVTALRRGSSKYLPNGTATPILL